MIEMERWKRLIILFNLAIRLFDYYTLNYLEFYKYQEIEIGNITNVHGRVDIRLQQSHSIWNRNIII